MLSCMHSLYILEINLLSNISLTNILSHSLGGLFILLTVPLWFLVWCIFAFVYFCFCICLFLCFLCLRRHTKKYCQRACLHAKSLQSLLGSCPTLCHRMDCSLPGSSVHWILQARTLEGCHTLPPGDLPDPRIEPHFLGFLHCWQILYCWATRDLEQTKPHIHTLVAKMRGEIF